MKQFAVFFMVIIAVLLSGAMEKTLPQEKVKLSEEELKNQEPKLDITTPVVKSRIKSTVEVVGPPAGDKKPPAEVGENNLNKESGPLKKGMSEKEKAEVEDLKSRFRKLVEDEMKKFGALEEPASKEEKKREGEEVKEKKEPEEVGEGAKKVAAEKKEKAKVPELEEGKEIPEEAIEEEENEYNEAGEEKQEEVVKTTPAESEKPEVGKKKIALDFEDADIREVITALAEIIGINYIVDPKVRGKVNIHTSGEISVEEILPILETIFEINNVAAVKVGNIYKIIPIKDVKKQPLIPGTGRELGDTSSPDRLILQIVPLRYIQAKEMEKILKRFLGKGGEIVDYPDRNILIIVDTVANMEKLLTLVDTVDLSIFDTVHVRFYELEYSEAKDVAKELEGLFNAMGIKAKKKRGGEIVSFIPIERLNIILAVSSMPEIFDKVAEWIEKLDGVREDLEEQIFIYFMDNAKAADIGDVLKELYGEKRRERTTRTTRTRTRIRKKKSSARVSRAKTGFETVTGEVKIVVDEVNNAIIIRATPQDYIQVLKTMKALDTIPKQVLVEVLIAEVTLDSNTEFGVEWSFQSDYARLGGYKGIDRFGQNFSLGGLGADLTKALPQSGFTYAFAADALEAFLRAYARENEVNILSTPHILVADNTEAKIDVGKEVPIVTSEYTPTNIQADTSLSRSIEYRDTGILLTVTPRINEKGLVAMEVNQEVSDVSEQRIEGINSPIILKRQAQTNLVVQNGRTIVIGGLIREKNDYVMEGIPYLSKIPYLGMIFSYNKKTVEKVELLFMITPHVVQTFEEAELVTEEFRERVKGLQKILGK